MLYFAFQAAIAALKVTMSNHKKFYTSYSSDDNSGLFNNKSVLQTNYRPLFLNKTDQIQTATPENTDQNSKCHSEECTNERRYTV